LAALYTQPYSGSVAIAHVLWSVVCREFRAVRFGGSALGVAAAAFLPGYLWVRVEWVTGVVRQNFHFAISAKTPLMIFREAAGAGYWGSGLLAILRGLAVVARRPSTRAQTLLLLLIALPPVAIVAADALGGYFVASRQFMWILPAVAVLAASAFERNLRVAAALSAFLVVVSIRQSALFFTAPRADWQATGLFLSGQAKNGACIEYDPPGFSVLYELFLPDMEHSRCREGPLAPQVVLAIPPTSTAQLRDDAIRARIAGGYTQDSESDVAGSTVVFFHRPQ